ncbi:MAG: DUF1501 domain-containing protein [Planctomycetaceae bacterium]
MTAKSSHLLVYKGGLSRIDLSDPKPLAEWNWLGSLCRTAMAKLSPLWANRVRHRRSCAVKSGLTRIERTWVSDCCLTLLSVDDIAVIAAVGLTESIHSSGVCQMNTERDRKTSILAAGEATVWVARTTTCLRFWSCRTTSHPAGEIASCISAGFMPAVYQARLPEVRSEPIPNLNPLKGRADHSSRANSVFWRSLTEVLQVNIRNSQELDAASPLMSHVLHRLRALEAVAIEEESGSDTGFVRYGQNGDVWSDVSVVTSTGRTRRAFCTTLSAYAASKWDAHSGIEANHLGLCQATDLPIAGLLKDSNSVMVVEQTGHLGGDLDEHANVGEGQ